MIKDVHLKMFQWYVLPWFRGSSPVVEQLGVVNSSLTELDNNLTLNCKPCMHVATVILLRLYSSLVCIMYV